MDRGDSNQSSSSLYCLLGFSPTSGPSPTSFTWKINKNQDNTFVTVGGNGSYTYSWQGTDGLSGSGSVNLNHILLSVVSMRPPRLLQRLTVPLSHKRFRATILPVLWCISAPISLHMQRGILHRTIPVFSLEISHTLTARTHLALKATPLRNASLNVKAATSGTAVAALLSPTSLRPLIPPLLLLPPQS